MSFHTLIWQGRAEKPPPKRATAVRLTRPPRRVYIKHPRVGRMVGDWRRRSWRRCSALAEDPEATTRQEHRESAGEVSEI